MLDQNQIQGLPSGVVLDDAPHDAAPASQPDAQGGITGLPPGVVLDAAPHDAVQTQTTPPEQPGILSRSLSGIGESLKNTGESLVAPAVAYFKPPQNHEEQIVATYGGGAAGLAAWRSAKSLFNTANAIVNAASQTLDASTTRVT